MVNISSIHLIVKKGFRHRNFPEAEAFYFIVHCCLRIIPCLFEFKRDTDNSADGTQICHFYSGKSRPITFNNRSVTESRRCH